MHIAVQALLGCKYRWRWPLGPSNRGVCAAACRLCARRRSRYRKWPVKRGTKARFLGGTVPRGRSARGAPAGAGPEIPGHRASDLRRAGVWRRRSPRHRPRSLAFHYDNDRRSSSEFRASSPTTTPYPKQKDRDAQSAYGWGRKLLLSLSAHDSPDARRVVACSRKSEASGVFANGRQRNQTTTPGQLAQSLQSSGRFSKVRKKLVARPCRSACGTIRTVGPKNRRSSCHRASFIARSASCRGSALGTPGCVMEQVSTPRKATVLRRTPGHSFFPHWRSLRRPDQRRPRRRAQRPRLEIWVGEKRTALRLRATQPAQRPRLDGVGDSQEACGHRVGAVGLALGLAVLLRRRAP